MGKPYFYADINDTLNVAGCTGYVEIEGRDSPYGDGYDCINIRSRADLDRLIESLRRAGESAFGG